uniref:Uncharacterized protein n=1 Tax=Octopus bimaculoides TaxID=37653 RepID=A0A0L8GFG7_OCTBM
MASSSVGKRTSTVPKRFPLFTKLFWPHMGFRAISNLCGVALSILWYLVLNTLYIIVLLFVACINACGVLRKTLLPSFLNNSLALFISAIVTLVSSELCLAAEAKPLQWQLVVVLVLFFSSSFSSVGAMVEVRAGKCI